jgi:predicted TIM-barrel fold metal-dependent hydrolase
LKNLTYVDCFTMIGKRGMKDELSAWRTENLLDEMDFCGINAALVTHGLCREYDPQYGNRMLLEEVKKSSKLIPSWSALPHYCKDFPKPKEFIKMMKDNNIRSVSLFPRSHNYTLNTMVCGELLTEFEANEIPVVLTFSRLLNGVQQSTFEEIDQICSAFPDLKIILQSVWWNLTRDLVPFMYKHKNIFVEFASLQANRVIEFLVEEFGADRLLFGTDFPDKSIGAAKSFIDYADISFEDRKKIAGENLLKLLKLENTFKSASTKEEESSILKIVKEGKPLDDILIIDSHSHMSHNDSDSVGYLWQKQSDAKGIVDRNKRIGIDITCISSWLGIWADYDKGNEVVLDATKQFPKNIIGYATLDPNYVEDWDSEIKKVHLEYGFKGLKPYNPRNGIPYNSPKYDKWYKFADENNLYALMHLSPNFKVEILDIAARYQNVTFILAHSGMTWPVAREHVEIAKARPNVVLEITLTTVTYGVIEYMVKEIGADRILFGTDQPMRDPIPQFGWVVYSRLTDEERIKILGQNMKKIIDRCKI